MSDSLASLRIRALVEAKQYLYQYPININPELDPIELLEALVREYETHLHPATRALAAQLTNGEGVAPRTAAIKGW